MEDSIVIATGGNAILRENQKGTFEEQMENIMGSMNHIIDLVQKKYKIVLTHGNGPQVGNILIQNEIASGIVPPSDLDVCVAKTQGQIGHMLEISLKNALAAEKMNQNVICVLTYTEVDENDRAFQYPSKPIGPFFTQEEAKALVETKGYTMVEDSGRGYRRAVPSPLPKNILESGQIKELLANNIVIAVGGGGIPVVRTGKVLKGIQAVIDKDLASAVLASQIQAEKLVILTGVEQVYINFGKDNQKAIDIMSIKQAAAYIEEGQFPPRAVCCLK